MDINDIKKKAGLPAKVYDGCDTIVEEVKREKEKMLKCLEEFLGIVSPAADKARIHRSTHYRWLKSDPEYKKRVREIADEMSLDYVETKHFQNIKKGKERSIIFHLETKGKKRGYIKRTEISGPEGKGLFDENEFIIKVVDGNFNQSETESGTEATS